MLSRSLYSMPVNSFQGLELLQQSLNFHALFDRRSTATEPLLVTWKRLTMTPAGPPAFVVR